MGAVFGVGGGGEPRGASPRDAALDALRSVALARVVLWHAVGATWLTAFAAVPLMFFVAGSLLAASLSRGSSSVVLARRVRRLLVPLWVYAAVVGAVGLAQAHIDGSVRPPGLASLQRALTWVVPVVDPVGAPWHGGWLSTHLWYVRAYLWVLLLAPVFAVLARRIVGSCVVAMGAIGALEATRWVGGWAGDSRMIVGDVVTYGMFAMLGMAHRQSQRTPRPAIAAAVAVVSGAAAVCFARWVGLPPGGVNGSYLAVALTGLAWVFAAAALERWLRAVAVLPLVRSVTTLVSRRALTIYLWHPAGIVVARAVAEQLGGHVLAWTLLLTLVFTIVAAGSLGFVEDIASGRRQWPRLPTVSGVVLVPTAVVTLAFALPFVAEPFVGYEVAGAAESTAPRPLGPPSFREALTNAAFNASSGPLGQQPIRLAGGRMPARLLQRALDRWQRATPDVDAVAVVLLAGGREWSGTSAKPGVAVMDVNERYPVLSLTKLFTIALVLRAADRGLVDLDAPVPQVAGVSVPAGRAPVTPRQLLQHTSGLADYRELESSDPERPLTPHSAVELALRSRPVAPPGTTVHYSSTNYLYLGLLLEQVTGRSYADLVAQLAAEAGTPGVVVGDDPSPGWIGYAAGGVRASQRELARFLEALTTPGRLLPPRWVDALMALGDHNLGLGTWPLCPCSTDASGVRRATAMGHHVGNGGLYHDPRGVTVSIRLEPPTPRTDAHVEALQRLLTAVLDR